jgi:hypothetical protein
VERLRDELAGYVNSAPPDGVIARRYMQAEAAGLSDDGQKYLYDCLLHGMRGEPMPEPRRGQAIGAADGVLIQQKARHHLPTIERIRAGEASLEIAPPIEPTQTDLPF